MVVLSESTRGEEHKLKSRKSLVNLEGPHCKGDKVEKVAQR